MAVSHFLNKLFNGQIIMQSNRQINPLLFKFNKALLINSSLSDIYGFTGKICCFFYAGIFAMGDDVLGDFHVTI